MKKRVETTKRRREGAAAEKRLREIVLKFTLERSGRNLILREIVNKKAAHSVYRKRNPCFLNNFDSKLNIRSERLAPLKARAHLNERFVFVAVGKLGGTTKFASSLSGTRLFIL